MQHGQYNCMAKEPQLEQITVQAAALYCVAGLNNQIA